jgi:beta-galactosidase beta subunit
LDTIDVPSEKPFDAENDFALYNAPASAYINVQPGEFLIVFPEDAHAPIIGEGKIKKLIAKIKL